MHNSIDWRKLLTIWIFLTGSVCLAFGCSRSATSPSNPAWLTVAQAHEVPLDGSRPIFSQIKGHLSQLESGAYVLTDIDKSDNSIKPTVYLMIQPDDQSISGTISFCVGEPVVVAGWLVKNGVLQLKAVSIDELEDIRRFVYGQCE